jgi:formate dehydrogenase major subunit
MRGIVDRRPRRALLAGRHDRLRRRGQERMPPGVVYTTFHHPVTGANVVTTENSDWATNCPEYKVTAVQVVRARHPDADPLP